MSLRQRKKLAGFHSERLDAIQYGEHRVAGIYLPKKTGIRVYLLTFRHRPRKQGLVVKILCLEFLVLAEISSTHSSFITCRPANYGSVNANQRP